MDDTEERTNGYNAIDYTRLSGLERQHSKGSHTRTATGSDSLKNSPGYSEGIYLSARYLLSDKCAPERHLENGIQDALWNV